MSRTPHQKDIESKLNEIHTIVHENNKNIALLDQKMEDQNIRIFSIMSDYDNNNKRIDNLEKSELKQKFMTMGITATVSILITIITVTKSLNLW